MRLLLIWQNRPALNKPVSSGCKMNAQLKLLRNGLTKFVIVKN